MKSGTDQIHGCSVLSLFHQAVERIAREYQVEKIDGVERRMVEKIPGQAIREAMANALVHRTWDIPTAIRVAMYPDKVEIRGYRVNDTVHVGQLKRAYKMLKSAKKPLILAGGGINVARANENLRRFVEAENVPVVTTIMGKGAIPTTHPLYVGNCGMHGKYAANKAVSECDLLFQ